MSTEVHDEEDEMFDEVDLVLASARLGLERRRSRDRKARCNINLSDIPENFAHVPSTCMSEPSSRAVSLDTSQPDFASRARYKPHLHKQALSFMTPMRWLRDRYMGCMRAVDANYDMGGVSGYNMTGPGQNFAPAPASSRPVGFF